jgi:hypothetical protein
MTEEQQRYLSYLLRLWQTSDGSEQVWRASLESPGSGERRGFDSLESLIDFLWTQTGCQHRSEGDSHARGEEGGRQ